MTRTDVTVSSEYVGDVASARIIAAKNMQKSVGNDFLRQHSRFAADELADANLRTRFFELLESTPTFVLVHHLLKAIALGNTAYAESIRFEFECRNDRHEYMTSFEMILAKMALHDPVELRKRLTNIRNAVERSILELRSCLGGRQTWPATKAVQRKKPCHPQALPPIRFPFFAGHHPEGDLS